MSSDQKPDELEQPGASPAGGQRRSSSRRKRGGRGQNRSFNPSSTPGGQRAPDGQRRPSAPQSAQTGPDAPAQTSLTAPAEPARQPRRGNRRRPDRRPRRSPSARPAQPNSDNPSSPESVRGSQPAGQESGSQADMQPSNTSRNRSKRRSPKPEDGIVEAHFIPPDPAQGRRKGKSGGGRPSAGNANRGGKPAGARGQPKTRRSAGESGSGTQQPSAAASRRGAGRQAASDRKNRSRVFNPDSTSEQNGSEVSSGQSTYVSLLGRFYSRPAPSVPIRTNRGIKARSQRGGYSQNWWARRWIESMEQLVDPARLQRGRSYARSGQVLSVQENPYGVEARVQGSRPAPYKVIIQLTPLTDDQWALVIDALAEQAIFTAQLLAGEMPANIEDAFEAAGVSLFPKLAGDLYTSCSCPDWANPCKHVAATHYILADHFDDDPFLLFRMRGRSQEQILAELNLRRGGQPTDAAEAEIQDEAAAAEQPRIEDLLDHFWEPAEPLDTFPLTINPPRSDMPLLTRLGEPAFLPGLSLLNILRPVYERFTYSALRAAYSEDEPIEANPSETDQEQDLRTSE